VCQTGCCVKTRRGAGYWAVVSGYDVAKSRCGPFVCACGWYSGRCAQYTVLSQYCTLELSPTTRFLAVRAGGEERYLACDVAAICRREGALPRSSGAVMNMIRQGRAKLLCLFVFSSRH
jgi:hypothetical protein